MRPPLELLHPDGAAPRVHVLGTGWPSIQPETQGPFDLILIGHPPRRRMQAAWLEEALRFADASLAPDGLAYVLPAGPVRRLRRSARSRGLEVELTLVHLPDSERSTFVAPLEPAALRYVVGELVLLPTWKRLVLLTAYRLGPARMIFGSIAAVVRRPGDRACYAWLAGFAVAGEGSVVISRTHPSADGCVVLHRLGRDGRPSTIAKVRPHDRDASARERAALASLSEDAKAAGAAVPESVASATIGEHSVHLLAALEGRLAATALARRPDQIDAVIERVSLWLLEWARRTARPAALERTQLEATILAPARLLAGRIRDGAAYVERLERLCAQTAGQEIALTAAHNDLTMWNVLLQRGGGIGVVDWEAAADASLPLVDFYYAVVDAASATQRYADRVLAYRRCFVEDGADSRRVAALERTLASELGLARSSVELGFHACWLHHAVNEARASPLGPAGPFVRILEAVAASGEAPVARELDAPERR